MEYIGMISRNANSVGHSANGNDNLQTDHKQALPLQPSVVCRLYVLDNHSCTLRYVTLHSVNGSFHFLD